jgi:hypothetical protein
MRITDFAVLLGVQPNCPALNFVNLFSGHEMQDGISFKRLQKNSTEVSRESAIIQEDM